MADNDEEGQLGGIVPEPPRDPPCPRHMGGRNVPDCRPCRPSQNHVPTIV